MHGENQMYYMFASSRLQQGEEWLREIQLCIIISGSTAEQQLWCLQCVVSGKEYGCICSTVLVLNRLHIHSHTPHDIIITPSSPYIWGTSNSGLPKFPLVCPFWASKRGGGESRDPHFSLPVWSSAFHLVLTVAFWFNRIINLSENN